MHCITKEIKRGVDFILREKIVDFNSFFSFFFLVLGEFFILISIFFSISSLQAILAWIKADNLF
jgi:hypothetical protein